MTLLCNPEDRYDKGRMLDLAVVSGMMWAIEAAPVGAMLLTLPVHDSGGATRQGHTLPATLSEDRVLLDVSSAGVP